MYSLVFQGLVLPKEEHEDEVASEQKDHHPMDTCPSSGKHDQELPILSMPFQNFRVKIYKQQGEPTRYFYEPILLLDPQKIACLVSNTGKACVRIPIQMWNEEVEEKVTAFLKKLPGSRDVENFYVQVQPYDELRLITSGDICGSYQPAKDSASYRHLCQSLNFFLNCVTQEEAESLVQSFRNYPEYYVEGLALECVTIKCVPNSKRSRLEHGAYFSTDVVRSCSSLALNLCTASSSSPPSSGAQSIPQVPAPSWSRCNVKVEPDEATPLEDVSVFLNESGLKGPFTTVQVIFIFYNFVYQNYIDHARCILFINISCVFYFRSVRSA